MNDPTLIVDALQPLTLLVLAVSTPIAVPAHVQALNR